MSKTPDIEDVHYSTDGDTHYFSAVAFADPAEMVAAQIGGVDALEDKFRRLELQCLLHASRKLPGVAAFSVKFERFRQPTDSRDQLTVDMTYIRTSQYYDKGDKCDKYKRWTGTPVRD